MTVILEPVVFSDRDAFLRMACLHFRELNPGFVPGQDWNENYFDRIHRNAKLSLRWVVAEKARSGFILFGIEDRIFSSQRNAVIYELYIASEFRRRGIASACARSAMEELQRYSPSKMQIDIVKDNRNAAEFWASLGFEKVSERWVFRNKNA